jgi:hypothetical protein
VTARYRNPIALRRQIARVQLVGLAVAIDFSTWGCATVSEGDVAAWFSKERICPVTRVHAHERPDLLPSQVDEPAVPPDEVAADPERLAMWRARVNRVNKANAARNAKYRVFEVVGCNYHEFFRCHPSRYWDGRCVPYL